MGSFGGILRYLAYALMVTAAAGLVLWVGIYSPDGLRMSVLAAPGHEPSTSEFSLVEYMQSVLLVACIAIFAWIAARDRLRRPLAIGFAALFLLFLVREQDYFLDHYGADNLWQVLASLSSRWLPCICTDTATGWNSVGGDPGHRPGSRS